MQQKTTTTVPDIIISKKKITSIGDSDRSRRKSKNQKRQTKSYRGQGK